jgi:signal transduction histidine kinase
LAKQAEVAELSEKALQQEREKQQILFSQNETLEKQVTERTAELKQSLEELKATQAQLIQKEKMASLGEFTAGIAHEIQNPLNFVNNFSEVSTELLEELKQEAAADNKDEVLAIADDLTQNLSKIHHHGKRADAIVKGMLQHSRSSGGEKQLTDINALADEYLRLAYHGFRAKEKDFNADFTLEADSNLSKVEVVPQEIGRVLLNLFNNAFYATQQKKAQLNGQYQPQVIVTTKSMGDKVEIRVRDNGTGILESVKSKIFQPFFTTKPTGEGTGLGLSLSYDIITKGHGGELKVDSKEEEYAEFIIWLPITK